MKKILVVSDSHKHNDILNKIFSHHSDIDTCIHAGDLQDNENGLEIKHLHLVSGNNDFDLYPQKLILNFEGFKIYVTHGHNQDIEVSDRKIKELSKEHNVQLCIFGHTHNPKYYQEDDIYYLNPGSVSFPRGSKVFIPTYAILALDDKIECHFYNAKSHECVDDLLFNPQPKQKKSFFSFFKK